MSCLHVMFSLGNVFVFRKVKQLTDWLGECCFYFCFCVTNSYSQLIWVNYARDLNNKMFLAFVVHFNLMQYLILDRPQNCQIRISDIELNEWNEAAHTEIQIQTKRHADRDTDIIQIYTRTWRGVHVCIIKSSEFN